MFTVWLVEGEAESDQLRLVEVEVEGDVKGNPHGYY